MSIPPLVSISIPVRNSAGTARLAVASVLAQSFRNFELIVLDDGSSDETVQILKSFNDPRLQIISDGSARGISFRLNQSVRLARGKYYARMDGDDLMHPDRVWRQVERMENGNMDVLGTDAWQIDDKLRIFGYYRSEDLATSPWDLVQRSGFIHPTVMARTEWLLRNPYPETTNRAEDLELWASTCAVSRFEVLHEPLLYYRMRNSRNIAPDLKTQRSTDEIILRVGTETGHAAEAKSLIASRKNHRARWIITGAVGLRYAKRTFQRIRGARNEFRQAQKTLDDLVNSVR